MRFSSLATIIAIFLANIAFWTATNVPISPGDSPFPLYSVSYNPFQRNESPFTNEKPSLAAIESDLRILATRTHAIRLYSSRELEQVPTLAKRYGLGVIAGAWLGVDSVQNKAEVDAAVRLAASNRIVKRLIIGNETQLKNIVPYDELVGYLREARLRLRAPVSTAEPWDYWLRNPELADEVDFIAVHILPYWMEVPVDHGVDYVFDKYRLVRQRFPDKVVAIAEAGWPSEGPQRGAAVATQAAQAKFVREFVSRAEKEHIIYNVIEAFDQPWKSATEGRAGEHFGIMDADRREKFPFQGLVLEDPNWRLWAGSSAILGLILMGVFLGRKRQLRWRARIFAALVLQALATSAVELARQASGEYMSGTDIVFWTVMVAAQTLLAIILVTDAAEIADVVGKKPLRRQFPPAKRGPADPTPFVSIHVACCSEPPDLMIQTLDSLAALDYPNFEAIIVDNNTSDERLWRPVEARCKELGDRFRFFSLGKWPGFKAGALNFALSRTNPAAQVVGVVDADYVVAPDWLNGTVPYFQDGEVALVQAPQEHRDYQESLFELMENDEYSGFFRIGMVQRNEDNAIIQHGTMTLIRRDLLDQVGGWAEWCICEDSELGLRLLCLGKLSVYVDHSFGHGLVPDNYESYRKQRFRWAYGGMRILRRYWRELAGITPGLTWAQRYQFLKGWLPWIGDCLHMFFTVAALIWSALLLVNPLETDFPEPIFVYPALALVGMRLIGTAWTYATRVRISSERILLAMIAGGSLTHVIAKAVLQGLVTSSKPFYRTPKLDVASPFVKNIASCWQEMALGASLIAASVGILNVFRLVNEQAVLWSVALIVQAIPYAAALVAAIVSSMPPRNLLP